jgi:hypothetical protein
VEAGLETDNVTVRVQVGSATAKDAKHPFCVPSVAGERLRRFITWAGRPCFNAGECVLVPVLGWKQLPLWVTPGVWGRIGYREPIPELADPNREEAASLKRLAVAAQRDIRGIPIPILTERYAYSDDSSTRRAAREGRALWRDLPAWPWGLTQDGQLPREWWRDRTIAAALEAWRWPRS